MAAKTHVLKGDTVVVRRGKEKGKRGIVKAVFPEAGQATVEGLNIVKRHTKQGQQGTSNMGAAAQTGGIIEKESPFPISALMVVDPKDNAPSRVRRVKGKDGAVHRVSARSGEQLRESAKGA
jgi:large subunit ribosomal protein L24